MTLLRIDVRGRDGRRTRRSQTAGPGTRAWYKARTNRLMRRLARADPEGAPTSIKQVIRGWIS